MAELFDRLFSIAIIVLIVIVLIGVVGGVGAYFYIKQKKKKRKQEKEVNYSIFQREDAKSYINIDDIKDDIIVTDGGCRFIGVIECFGFDFYSAHVAEQSNTYDNYVGFINIIDKPISYRQYCSSVDLEETIEMYKEVYMKVCSNLERAELKMDEMKGAIEKEVDMPQTRRELYTNELLTTEREIKALQFRKFHLEDQIRHISENSGVSTSPMISSTYVFDWTYDAIQFSVDLSEEEIFYRAKLELESIANAKIHALSMAGVKAKRCTTNELIDMCRRHSQPISAERYKMRDVLNSSYFDDITTTDFKNRMYSAVRETMDREASELLYNTFANDEKNSPEQKPNILLSAGKEEGGSQDASE